MVLGQCKHAQITVCCYVLYLEQISEQITYLVRVVQQCQAQLPALLHTVS